MKKISLLIAFILFIFSNMLVSYASTEVPVASISNVANGTVTITLDAAATENTKVYYRILEGSAHRDAGAVNDIGFISVDDSYVIFSVGDTSKTFTITHNNPTSYQQSQRQYIVQIYKTEGNANITTNGDHNLSSSFPLRVGAAEKFGMSYVISKAEGISNDGATIKSLTFTGTPIDSAPPTI